jgi:VanZ family protein
VTDRLLPWVPAAAWAALLFFLSSRPSLPSPDVAHFDKVAHFGAYLVLGGLLAFAVDRAGLPLVVAVVLGSAYGASDEIHQMFVPGRTPSVADWVADTAGVLTAVLLYARWRAPRTGGRRTPRRADQSASRA